MRLRAQIRLKNDHIMAALAERGWSQSDLARHLGARPTEIGHFCNMQYADLLGRNGSPKPRTMRLISMISEALGLSSFDVWPNWAAEAGNVKFKAEIVRDIPDEQLLGQAADRLALEAHIVSELAPSSAEDLRRAMTCLDHDELDVITSRFGLDGKNPQTFEAIGQSRRLTKERIRQIEVKAIEKLHHRLSGQAG